MLTSLHVEGERGLHRLGAEAKLAGLAAAGVALFLSSSAVVLGVALALAMALYLTAGMRPGTALRRIAPTLYSVAFLMAFNLVFLPPAEVAVLALRILTLVFAAAAVTATTRLEAMMTAVDRLTRPFERLGLLRPGDAGLTVGLCLRFVPEILARYHALAEAHRARGIKIRPLTMIGPLIILTLRQADDIAAAIDARGLRAATSQLNASDRNERHILP